MSNYEDDPWLHLEWDQVDFSQFLDHITQLLVDTTWRENVFYPPGIIIGEGNEFGIILVSI